MPRLQLASSGVVGVEDVGDAAGHSGGEVSAGGTEDDGGSAGHVFAGVVADAFDDGGGAGVADAEAFGARPRKKASPLIAP